jgi:hypothetical protein
MEHSSVEDKKQCALNCESAFVRCTSQQPGGCVEALRLCRESCKWQSD